MADTFDQPYPGQPQGGAPGDGAWPQPARPGGAAFDPRSGESIPAPPVGRDPARTRPAPLPTYAMTSAGGGAPTMPVAPSPTPAQPGGRSPSGTVSRRALLIGAGAGAAALGVAGAGVGAFLINHHTSAGNSQATLPDLLSSDAVKINHLLRRAGFGPTPSDIGTYLSLGVQGSIDHLLNYSSIPDDLDNRLAQMQFDFTKAADLINWWLLRMIYSQHPLEEKMTLFWAGVLTSSLAKIGKADNFPYLITQNNLLRAKGMGRFDDLIHDISIDPAMLWWLDGRTSTGKAPNENYARELMELFTLGLADKNGKPNYTQNDVHQGALALAGWVDRNGKGVLVPSRQYKGQVTYLGKTGNLGLSDVVQLVCAHPSTGRFIAWRMWRFFAYNTTLDDPVLQPLADAYYHSDHNIGAMVKAMLTSPDFFSAKAYRRRIKSPTEFFVSAIRALGLQVSLSDLKSAPGAITAMGQTLFDPPNVSGWDGDKDSTNWLGTQNWMTRVNYINTLAASATGGVAAKNTTASSSSTIQGIFNTFQLKTSDDVANYLLASLVDNTVTPDRTTLIKSTLSQAGTGTSLTLTGGGSIPAANVRQAVYLVMSMPEFQLN